MKLPRVDECVDHLFIKITGKKASMDTPWAIIGPPTAGKSVALRRLHTRLSSEPGVVSLLVAPPAGALDAAPIATVEVGGGLHDASLINGKLDVLLDPHRPWTDKLKQLEACLNEHKDRVVLLCDDLNEWRPPADDTGHWATCVNALMSLLLDRLRCRRVVTQEEPDFRTFHPIRLEPSSDVESWLQNAGAWGDLHEAASELWATAATVLPNRSPLEIRLLVAVAGLTSVSQSAVLAKKATTVEIADALFTIVDQSPDSNSLREAWVKLALLRRSIAADLLDLTIPMTSPACDIVRNCLLYEVEDQFFLHDILKQSPLLQKWVGDEGRQQQRHRCLAQYFKDLTPHDTAVTTRALSAKMEAMYHATLALDPSEDFQAGLYFVEQLDAMARAFSFCGKYQVAESLYRKSIALQPRNDYAHHFLAFNLLRQGRNPRDIEHHYEEAIKINARHPWWWSRYIIFLLLRGRELDARKAWREGLAKLRMPGGEASLDFYTSLHGRVLDLLLDRGLLDFANEILESIPRSFRAQEPLSSLRARYEALVEVREYGSYLPAPFVEPEWWLKDPPLVARRLRDNLALEEWLACRVDGVDPEHSFSVQAARVVLDQRERPQAVAATFSWDKLDTWSIGNVETVEVGDFLVIGIYRQPGGHPQARLRRFFLPAPHASPWDDPWLGERTRGMTPS